MNIGLIYTQNPLAKLHLTMYIDAYIHTQRIGHREYLCTPLAQYSQSSLNVKIHEYMSVSLFHFSFRLVCAHYLEIFVGHS